MKRIIIITAFVILSAVLISIGVFFATSESRMIASSELITKKYGGLCRDSENNLISIYPYHGKKAFLKNVEPVTALADDCQLPVYLAIPPRKMDVLDIPEDIDKTPYNKLFSIAKRESRKHDIVYVDLLDAMAGDNLYFATDHHWTSHGAYLAYREIITEMGKAPLEESDFEITVGTEKYRGSDWGKSDKSEDYTVYDTIELYFSKNYDKYTTTIVSHPYDTDENNVVSSGLYKMEALTSWDPYTVYFGGNNPYVTVRSNEPRETLMLVRDSFASALAPFLAEHFDLVLVDPRFYPEKLSKVVEREGITAILVLENMGTFTENTIKITY